MAEATESASIPMNRREFLFYIWGASMAVALAGSTGALLWFAYPRFREGEFGGIFRIPASVPPVGAAPVENPEGRYWLITTEDGVAALYKVCTHLGCLYKWVPSQNRFECPCHGSKFTREGQWIEGPAPRNLDRFVVRAVDDQGNVLDETDETGTTDISPEVSELLIDTGEVIEGEQHQ